MKSITVKYASKAFVATGLWFLYSATRFGLKRFGYIPTVLRRTRFISIPLYVGYIHSLSKKYEDAHGNDELKIYRRKRMAFERHTKIMKDLLRSKINMANAKTEFDEGNINIKRIINT